MHVEATQAGNIQHRLGNDQAVGHHHKGVQIQITQLLADVLALQVFRLQHGNLVAFGQYLDRALLDFLAAPGGPVRLGQYGNHLVVTVEYRPQAGGGEIRGAGEGKAEWFQGEPLSGGTVFCMVLMQSRVTSYELRKATNRIRAFDFRDS